MATYKCEVCEYLYDEEKEGTPWDALPADWGCPVCGSAKKFFTLVEEAAASPLPAEGAGIGESQAPREPQPETGAVPVDLRKTTSDTENYFGDIQEMAETGKSVYEPMRTKEPTISWDEVLFRGAQLATMPLNSDEPVETETIIGPRSSQPLVIGTPVYISHMSFGALSKEAKTALAMGSAAVKTAICSGEGGILPEEIDNAYKYVFEFVPNQYSASKENLQRADAIEIKIGQSAKPGMGGHLPGHKVTDDIARIRGFQTGVDIVSPSRFRDISNRDDLRQKVTWLRDVSGGKPIGIKLAAGHIERDLEIVVYAEPDFITIDGRAGATGSAPKFVKASASVPTIFALYRARKFLGADRNISLVITGGLRVSSDFAKALAMGADAVAISTVALIAIGCQQYRICNTGKCPVGIATQDPALRARLSVPAAAKRLENFLRVSTEELKDFARLTGTDDVHKLLISDLCTTNSEISNHTEIEHA
jgi:glutamate synthase domain-containing protein 2/rubredoxin